MRKRILSLVLAALMLGSVGAQASAAQAAANQPQAVGAAETKTAYVSKMEILLDGEVVKPSGYLISVGNGSAYTYFKLRDIAYLMQSKDCKFAVGYDNVTHTISLTRGKAYQGDGSEMKPVGSGNQKAVASTLPVLIDGEQASMEAYIINGFTYYKLRDIGENLGFEVDYRNDSKQGVMKTPGYVEPEPEPTPDPEPPADPEDPDTPDTPQDPDNPDTPEDPGEPEGPDLTAHIDGKLTVLIDVGHGGTDGGSEGVAPVAYTNYKGQEVAKGSKMLEKDFNLPVALYLRDMLEASGATVIMTRETDKTVSFATRKEIIQGNAEVADLCFSVHHNAFNTNAVGYELLAQIQYKDGGAGKELGAVLAKYYSANGRPRHRTTVFREGQQGDYYAILRYAAEVNMLATISEYAFIDNAEDVQCVLSDAGLRAEAQAMHDAILEFFETHEY